MPLPFVHLRFQGETHKCGIDPARELPLASLQRVALSVSQTELDPSSIVLAQQARGPTAGSGSRLCRLARRTAA